MAKNRAFTLIELLVVIAIIAILAAILFPVFAQAKAAAKAAASISNSKQITLATIQYSADVDDLYVIQQSNGNQPGAYTHDSSFYYTPWTKLIHPYAKNTEILKDPTGPGVQPFTGLTSDDSWFLTPHYGFNVVGLNNAYSDIGYQGKSGTATANPADTVLLVSKSAYQDLVTGSFPGVSYGTWSARYASMAMPPSGLTSVRNWGKGGSWDSGLKTMEAGRQTGANSYRANNNFVVAFTDGHVGKRTVGAMAAGTNLVFDPTGVNTTAASATAVTDKTKYIWDVE